MYCIEAVNQGKTGSLRFVFRWKGTDSFKKIVICVLYES